MPGKKSKRKKSNPPITRTASAKKAVKKDARKTVAVGKAVLDTFKKNQRQLKIVLDAAQMGIWEWDLKTNKVAWAGKVFEIYRLSGRSFASTFEVYQSMVHPQDRSKIEEGIKQTLEHNKPYSVEHRIVKEDGSILWIFSSGTVLRNKVGKPLKMTGTVQDITHKKQIEKESDEWKTRYEAISSSAGLVVYDNDIESNEIVWSGNSMEVLGYKAEELGSIDRWIELIHPDDREEAFRLLEIAQKNLQRYDVCYRFEMKTGEFCHMNDRGFFVANTKGNVIRMLGMMSDVTERVRAEALLRESELRFRTLQEASFGGIGLHDKGIIIDCNQGLCDLTGYSYEELIGSNGVNLVAPEWRDFVIEKITSGYDRTYDVEGIRKDKTRYVLEVRGKNMPFENKTIRVTEFRDITERKRTQEKIIEQNTRLLAVTEDLKRKNNQLEEFTQIVSHNLRSPVGNILTLLSFYDGTESAEEKSEYISLLKEAGATTHTMLNELNDILKIKQTKNIEKQHLEFEIVLQRVMSMLSARVTELSATITFDFLAAPTIHYPVIYLESILLNLLDNALKYHSPNRTPFIEVKTELKNNGNLMLRVADNGLGINLERYGHQVFKLRKTFHPS